MADAKFIDGIIAKKPSDSAPEYVKATLSIRRQALIGWLEIQEGEWVNADLKESRYGKLYVQVNTYKADKPKRENYRPPAAPAPAPAFDDDSDLPF